MADWKGRVESSRGGMKKAGFEQAGVELAEVLGGWSSPAGVQKGRVEQVGPLERGCNRRVGSRQGCKRGWCGRLPLCPRWLPAPLWAPHSLLVVNLPLGTDCPAASAHC